MNLYAGCKNKPTSKQCIIQLRTSAMAKQNWHYSNTHSLTILCFLCCLRHSPLLYLWWAYSEVASLPHCTLAGLKPGMVGVFTLWKLANATDECLASFITCPALRRGSERHNTTAYTTKGAVSIGITLCKVRNWGNQLHSVQSRSCGCRVLCSHSWTADTKSLAKVSRSFR